MWIHRIESKNWTTIQIPMNKCFLTKLQNGEKEASLTNGARVTECLHVKECKQIHMYHTAHNTRYTEPDRRESEESALGQETTS